MRTILGLNLVCLLAATAFAQDRNFPAALGTGLPPLNSSSPPQGLNYGGFPRGDGSGFDGYGYGFDGYGYAAPYSNVPRFVNRLVLVQQPAVPAAPPAPPAPTEPIHSSIQNVKGSFIQNVKGDPKQNPSSAPVAFFMIILKNGSQLTASAVWVQGNHARYMDGNGQGHRVPLADVDRTATLELNQTNHLNLRLPPPGLNFSNELPRKAAGW
ncbi:MAG: hypothetical protein ABI833_00430 [Acidobacteriota bacterium]